MKTIITLALIFILSTCTTDPLPREYIIDLLEVEYVIFNTNEGIYPHHALILQNPHNPYAQLDIRLNDDNKFMFVFSGNNAARFYAWATALNFAGANGEEQFRVAQRLADLASEETSNPNHSKLLSNMARQAYLACYEFFFYDTLDAGNDNRDQVGCLAFAQLTNTDTFNNTNFSEFSERVVVTTNADGRAACIKEGDLREFDKDARDEEEGN